MKFSILLILTYVIFVACSSKSQSPDAISEATPIPWVEIAKKDSSTLAKKVLVVAFSPDNAGKTLAKNIAKPFNADVEMIVDKKKRSGCSGFFIAGKDASFGNLTQIEPIKRDPSKYDLIIVGTPIWAWDMSPAIRTYLSKYKDKFSKVAFYTISGNTEPEKTVGYMEEVVGVKNSIYTGFVIEDFEDKPKYGSMLQKFTDSLAVYVK